MQNVPTVKMGIVAVSRDCFPIDLSRNRRIAAVAALRGAGGDIYEAQTIVENEQNVAAALAELDKAGCNALVVYLGNFGPETPETMLAQRFAGPVMFAAAAEENIEVLSAARGDAYCGMLNASYNIGLRRIPAYVPPYPVGTPEEVAAMIAAFMPVARMILGLQGLKIITFGPRPNDFLACNAPVEPLYRLGVEIQENSELDLYKSFLEHEGDSRVADIAADMAAELGLGNKEPGILPKLAQYELTLTDWVDQNRGAATHVALANKCWPAFQPVFGFVPCYVNSRLASRLMPVACEVDVYGALSEYLLACATEVPPTLLDINNTVPAELYDADIAGKFPYGRHDVFMGFHCGNTPACHLQQPQMKYQLIMHRLLEPDKTPDITRGTLEGDIKPGGITFFRLQSDARGVLRSYIAQGEVLPVASRSFGGVGIFAIEEMARFYRHVLVSKRYPHHGAVGFAPVGEALFSALQMIGVEDIAFNQPAGMLYAGENPFYKGGK